MRKITKRDFFALWSRILLHTSSWKTKEHIIVIESDDWGAIRTSDLSAYNYFKNLGYKMENSPYTFDALESNEDLDELFNVLNSYKDINGNPACITANMIMANPDFKKIKDYGYNEYFWHSVADTLEEYENRDRVRNLWNKGLKDKMFFPQVHAREHIRYWEWIKDLKQGNEETIESFKFGMCGLPLKVSRQNISYYKPIYIDDTIFDRENISLRNLILDGFNFFENEFGFKSESTIAPNCGWTSSTEKIWKEAGVKYIQGGYLQEHHYDDNIRYIPHYLGQKSKINGLKYLVRNCIFEPAYYPENENYWLNTFNQIEKAFSSKKPAVISSHRMNFIGTISTKNRENSLKQLNSLLTEVVKKWPDVIFCNSVELGEKLK